MLIIPNFITRPLFIMAFFTHFTANRNLETLLTTFRILRLYEHIVWCLRTDDMGKLLTSFPSDPYGLKKRFGEQTYAQGVGRHSQEEVEELLKQDLEKLSEILGSSKKITALFTLHTQEYLLASTI